MPGLTGHMNQLWLCVCASTLDGIVRHQQQSFILIECIFILRSARTAFIHTHNHTHTHRRSSMLQYLQLFSLLQLVKHLPAASLIIINWQQATGSEGGGEWGREEGRREATQTRLSLDHLKVVVVAAAAVICFCFFAALWHAVNYAKCAFLMAPAFPLSLPSPPLPFPPCYAHLLPCLKCVAIAGKCQAQLCNWHN